MMDSPVRFVKGVGPKREKILHRIGVFSLRDLLYCFPLRYQDRTRIDEIASLKEGSSHLIKAEVAALSVRKSFYGRKAVCEGVLKDSSGVVYSAWFNRPYLDKFQNDIRNQRFNVIISEPVFNRYKDRDENWAEENNVWVEAVSEPILCYYDSVLTIKEFRTQLLTPKTEIGECK